MANVETYIAQGGAEAGAAAAGAPGPSPFMIVVRFLGGLTDRQKDAFKGAANRWTRAIIGDLPSVLVDGETIDDLLILAQGAPIDGTACGCGIWTVAKAACSRAIREQSPLWRHSPTAAPSPPLMTGA